MSTRRENFSPAGARRSMLLSFLPLNPLMLAARDKRPFEASSRSLAAGVSLGPSSARTTATPSWGRLRLAKEIMVWLVTRNSIWLPRPASLSNGQKSAANGPRLALSDAALQQREEIQG